MNGRVEKTYHALVFGIPVPAEGEIKIRLGNDASSGFQTVRIADEKNGEEAATKYRVLWSAGGYSWLEITPLTGRTHQIRAHLSLIGNPIVGDKIYIDLNIFSRYVIHGLDTEMLGRLKMKRLALHASSLGFVHPATRTLMTLNSEIPQDMRTFLDNEFTNGGQD